jgi:hypothetical protein
MVPISQLKKVVFLTLKKMAMVHGQIVSGSHQLSGVKPTSNASWFRSIKILLNNNIAFRLN